MAVRQFSLKERRFSNAGTVKTAYTSRRITYGYINNPARLKPIRYLQSTLR